MVKDAIGILDNGLEGFSILETLTEKFKNENFIYLNDLVHNPYFNMPEDDALNLIKANIKKLKDLNIKLLIVSSDIVVDASKEYLDELNIPVLDIVSIYIDYINENYEQKNIGLFGKTQIIEANLYQKNFKYNRLYNISSDELEELIVNNGLKTSQSFIKTKEAFKQIKGKDLDVLIASSPYLITLKTEITEFTNFNEMTDFGEILANKILTEFMDLNVKGRGKVFVYSNVEKSKFKKMTSWSNIKYKYIDLDKRKRRERQKLFQKISKKQ